MKSPLSPSDTRPVLFGRKCGTKSVWWVLGSHGWDALLFGNKRGPNGALFVKNAINYGLAHEPGADETADAVSKFCPTNPHRVGQRVQLHPATDRWMMGDRYGVVVSARNPHKVRVKLDRSGKTVSLHVSNVEEIS